MSIGPASRTDRVARLDELHGVIVRALARAANDPIGSRGTSRRAHSALSSSGPPGARFGVARAPLVGARSRVRGAAGGKPVPLRAPRSAPQGWPCTGCSCPERRPYWCLSSAPIRRREAPGTCSVRLVAAWLLVLALVVPVGAVEGPTRLFDPSVSPTAATPDDDDHTDGRAIATARDPPPAYVRVVIDGTAHEMTGDGSDDWKKGVGHHYATKLAAGTHEVSFVAADTRKFSDEVDGGIDHDHRARRRRRLRPAATADADAEARPHAR